MSLQGFEKKTRQNDEIKKKNSADPLERERGICMSKDCNVRKVFLRLRDCTNRVQQKPYTAETCHEEMMDLVTAIDHCVGSKAFTDLR